MRRLEAVHRHGDTFIVLQYNKSLVCLLQNAERTQIRWHERSADRVYPQEDMGGGHQCWIHPGTLLTVVENGAETGDEV